MRKVLSVLLVLAGCASPSPRYFEVEADPGRPIAVMVSGPARTIAVREVQVPRFLDRTEIVRKSAAGRVDIAGNDWWDETLATMLRRVLAADLSQRLPGTVVIGTGDVGGATAEVVLGIEAFQPDADGTVVLTGYLLVEAGGQRRLLRRIGVRVAPAGGTVGDQVKAMGQALGQVADIAAETLAAP